MVWGAHERHINGKFRERRLAWKKGYDPARPRTTFQYECPRVFTSIYLKVITSYYAHILLTAMLYFDRIRPIQDSKLTKQKYVNI